MFTVFLVLDMVFDNGIISNNLGNCNKNWGSH